MALPMHLTPRQCGALAAIARPKRLVLTHFYPPVEAVDIAGQVAAQFDGTVVCCVTTAGHSNSRRRVVMLVVMHHGATRRRRSKPSARPSRTWATGPCRCRANSARRSGSSATTDRWTTRTSSGLPGVAQVIHVSKPYKQVSREWRPENTLVKIGRGVVVGGRESW